MTIQHYPLMVDLQGQKIVVVGAGLVASRKIRSLLENKADITVVGPDAVPEIEEWAEKSLLTWHRRHFVDDDLASAFLVIAATGDHEANTSVARAARSGQLIHVAGYPELGNFHLPSVFHRGRLVVAVSTNGASPMLSKAIRDGISKDYGEEYETYLDFLYECREIIKQLDLNHEQKRNRLKDLLDPKYLDPGHQAEMIENFRKK